MGYPRGTKSEHNGAKNGGGMWATRAEAKQVSKRLRRINDKREAENFLVDVEAIIDLIEGRDHPDE